jgi:phage gp36-like protein
VYSSVADVRNAISPEGSATDPSTAASIAEARIVDAIAEADAVLDMFIGARYTIAMDTSLTPNVAKGIVRWWSRTIAAYLITLTFKKNQDIPDEEPIKIRYQMVMDLLTQVQKGDLDINLIPVDGNDGSDVFVYNHFTGDLWTKEEFLGSDAYAGSGWRIASYVNRRWR